MASNPAPSDARAAFERALDEYVYAIQIGPFFAEAPARARLLGLYDAQRAALSEPTKFDDWIWFCDAQRSHGRCNARNSLDEDSCGACGNHRDHTFTVAAPIPSVAAPTPGDEPTTLLCWCGHDHRSHIRPDTLGSLTGFWGCHECIDKPDCQHHFNPYRVRPTGETPP